jgi:hypothetical protein
MGKSSKMKNHLVSLIMWEYTGHIFEGDMVELAQTQGQAFGKLLSDITSTSKAYFQPADTL